MYGTRRNTAAAAAANSTNSTQVPSSNAELKAPKRTIGKPAQRTTTSNALAKLAGTADTILGPRYATRRAVLGDVSNVTATVVPEITRTNTAMSKYGPGGSQVPSQSISQSISQGIGSVIEEKAVLASLVESVSNNIQNQQQQQQQQLKESNANNPKQNSIDAETSRLAQEINNNTLLKQKALKSTTANTTTMNQGAKRTFGGLANNANILNPTNGNKDVPMKRALEGGEPQENSETKPLWDDLDAEDIDDPLMVAEYVQDIVKYMRQLEVSIAPMPNYMDCQKEISWNMRSILIDWLIEVQWKLKLLPETLFLSVNLIDRFLSKRAVSMPKLQLVGLTASLIASKVEEVLAPSVANFIYLADNAYEASELLKAERYMLQVLNFAINYPNPLTFLRRVSKAETYDTRSRTLAKYFMESALVDSAFVTVSGSLLAAGSIYLARQMLSSTPLWTPNLEHYSTYSEKEVKECADKLLEMYKTVTASASLDATYKKYASKKLMKASVFVEEWIKRQYPECPAALNSRSAKIADESTQ